MSHHVFELNFHTPDLGGATSESTPIRGLESFGSIVTIATLIGATNGTLDVYVQSLMGDDQWWDCIHYPQLAAGFNQIVYIQNLIRFGAQGPTATGPTLFPALAANAAVFGNIGSALRFVAVSGAGTTAGADIELKVLADTEFDQ